MPKRAVPTLAELEARIDEAVVIARASEEGVGMVGEVALDAARQARRAAEAAEESARAAKDAAQGRRVEDLGTEAGGPAGPVSDTPPGRSAGEGPPSREVVIDPLQRFNARADAIAARLQKLERLPA